MKTPLATLLGALLVLAAAACGRAAERGPQPGDADLVRRTGIPEPVLVELRGYGTDLEQLEGQDSTGDAVARPGITAAVADEDHSRAAVEELRRTVGPGYYVLRTEHGFGRAPERVAVVRAASGYDVLLMLGTNGWNRDIGPDSVIAWLRRWDAAVGLTIVGAGNDWVEAKIARPPADMLPFARSVYELCPDAVEQGTETVQALASDMAHSHTLYLWWD